MTEIRMKNRITAGSVFLALAMLICRSSPAAIWNLTDAQFNSRSVEVESIDASGIHIAENSSATILPWKDVLELWQNAAAPAGPSGRFLLVFRSGDALDGEAVSLSADTLQWRSPRLGEINFPIDSLLAIVRSGSSPADLDENRGDDVVRLANGDTGHGIITQIASGGVTIQAERRHADASVGCHHRGFVLHDAGQSQLRRKAACSACNSAATNR